MSLVCVPTIFVKPGKVADVAKLMPIQDSLENQPKTLAYYFFSLQKSPETVVGFELYTDKSGLKEHGIAASFKEFGQKAGPFFTKPFTLDQAGPVCGFLTKSTESASQIVSDRSNLAVLATIYCHSAEHRIRFLEEAAKIIPQVEAEEGTLSYYWSADLKDLTKILVFERYTSAEAAKKHSTNARPFMVATKDLVKSATIDAGTPIGGFLKKGQSLMESQSNAEGHLAPPLASSTTPPLTSPDQPFSKSPKVQDQAGGSAGQVSGGIPFTAARDGMPQSIAHRGYKALFPENTMIALEGALRSGADGIETDVHLSRDGIVVIAHDPSTLRCYGRPGNVWDQDFYGGPGSMSRFTTVDAPHTRMPTLRQVLKLIARDEWRGRWVLLDVKVDNQVEVIEAMADTLRSLNPDPSFWRTRVVLGIWHHKFLPACDRHLAGLPITHIGLHTAYARRYFLHHPQVGAFNLQLHALVTASQQDFVRQAHRLGKQTYVWTVNDGPAMRFCRTLAVDAILSDDPGRTGAVRDEDLTHWHPDRDYWTPRRVLKAYLWNAVLFLVMLRRIFWTFRDLRSQPYVLHEQEVHEE
ncbi:Glycerophosphoryl diester phosphodiesterase [Taphrina deformans PYCC 5710]|uniref:Glycerophosphoryl diester phosphodiesterase n=1 Tax=Taphrina deformans (strain PYCC 5710 / ATCC 11124 / CBS 356.35 / IMI 108563 / JCM 9778 / NBRC 8474) TaxID=1097556 RepID=R4XFS4_TAPDE|nr:Glycerophosphoryl diester phosphodiesterase [Taphrina deformans PYCC 5710]|eukprot:CCG83344.1 Glycerophosphoryl diester phosphodiesterase [Taphrina deformans PYCC 5710]